MPTAENIMSYSINLKLQNAFYSFFLRQRSQNMLCVPTQEAILAVLETSQYICSFSQWMGKKKVLTQIQQDFLKASLITI